MVSINYSAREVCCKIVYYGPGLSGKTTNLQYVHSKVPQNTRGNLISLATEADRTLYFDFLPINIGTINGFAARFQLYTVPGQVYYNATRKLVLRGVDGVVFVADSQPDKMDENIESLLNLEENLKEYGYDVTELPIVIQYNKRDLPGVMSVEELNAKLNPHGWPHFEAAAPSGTGVFDTLKLVIKLVLEKAKTTKARTRPSAITAPAAQPAPQPEIPNYPTAVAAASAPSPFGAAAEAPSRTGFGAPVEQPSYPPRPAASAETYRPYPGSTGTQSGGVATVEKRNPAAGMYGNTGSASESATSTITRPFMLDDNKGISDSMNDSGRVRPAMAPPLKRRPEAKKRGFFKRLFGIR